MRSFIKHTVFIFIATVIFLSTMTGVGFALDFDGNAGTGSGGSLSATGGYAVSSSCIENGSVRPTGYRFSVINSNGQVQGSGPYDVFRYSTSTNAINRDQFTVKYAKTQLKSLYKSTSFSTGSNSSQECFDTDINITLPEYTTGVEEWSYTESNVNAILKKINSGWTVDTLSQSAWSVLVEPIYTVQLESVWHSLTVTEIAVYGSSKFGASVTPGASNTQGTWNFIGSYTNKYFPNSLKVTSGRGLFAANPATLTSNASFATVIEKGYGVAILYGEHIEQTYLTVNYYSNYATQSFSGALNAVGSTKNVLVRTAKFMSDVAYPNGLHDYVASTNATYLARTGYTASGTWGTSPSGGTIVSQYTGFNSGADLAKAFGKDISNNNVIINVYAQWTPDKYTVTYDANGGSGAPATQTKTHDIDLTLSTVIPTRPVYMFKGWNTKADGTGTSYATGAVYSVDANVTLYAQWNKVETTGRYFHVVYNANGGEGAPENQIKEVAVDLSLSTIIPTRTGYTFTEWNTSRSGWGTSYAPGSTYTNNEGIILYAQWTPSEYTVTYNANGGLGAPAAQTKTYDVDLTLSTVIPTRPGYMFTEWNTAADGSGTSYSPNAVYGKNAHLTLYAQWKTLVKFDENYDGRSVNLFTDTTDGKVNGITTTWDQESSTLTFDGTTTAAGDSILALIPVEYQYGDMYTIAVEYVGGTKSATCNYVFGFDEKIIETNANPSTGRNYVDVGLPSTNYMINSGTLTVTGEGNGLRFFLWANGTMTFDDYTLKVSIEKASLNSGVYTVGSQIASENQPYGTLPVPVRSGYEFKSWNTKADGTGTTITADSVLSEGGATTLYAQWRALGGYVDGQSEIAKDTNSGATPSDPVKTFKQAYINLKDTGGIIYVVNTVPISSEMTLTSTYYEDADGKIELANGKSILIKRYVKPTTVNDGFNVESNLNTMIEVNDGAHLTLSNLTVDGHKNAVSEGTDNQIAEGVEVSSALITVETGILNVQEGTVLQNNNNPSGTGGGVYVMADGTLNMTGGLIQNHNAKFGAGVYNEGALTLAKGTIASNVAYWKSGYMVSGNGGGIYSTKSFSLPEGVVIKNNFAVNGGGVYIETDYDAPTEDVSVLTFDGAEITGNSAGDGAGIYVGYSNLIVKSGKISGNNAGDSDYDGKSYGYGGGISVSGDRRTDRGIVSVLGGEISNNTVVSSYGAYGGGIYSHWATINMEGGIITNNSCTGGNYNEGGGVFLNERSVLNMSGGTISKNSAEEGGGVALIYYYDSTANFSGNAVVTENTATYCGGGVYNYGCGSEGGGIFVEGNARIDNNSAQWGGGIYCDYGYATVSGGTVESNTASYGGGVYLYNESVLTLTSNSIYSNKAEELGAGVYVCGAGEYNDISTFKMYDAACVGDTDRDGVSDTDDVYLEEGCYVLVPSEFSNVSTNSPITTSKKSLRAIVTPEPSELGRVIAKFGDESSTEGKKALYWNPDHAQMSEQYFVVEGEVLRSGDQGASDIDSIGVTARDVFISRAYDIVYDANGGSNAPASQTKYWNEDLILCSEKPVRNGYTFQAWNTEKDGSGTTYESGALYTANAHQKLYAQWKANKYTIEYDGNGYTDGSTESSEHTYDEEKALTPNGFTKEGYIFEEWNTKPDGSGESYKDKEIVKNLSSKDGDTITLYAQWTPIKYTIEYDGNGNIGGSTQSSEHIYDEEKPLTPNGFTKPGYKFKEWNTKPDGSGTSYTDEQLVKNLSSTNSDKITLYAQWEEMNADGLGYKTIMVGDVVDPELYLDEFTLPEGKEIDTFEVIYNGVPRDDEDKATTPGTGYTIVYIITFTDGTEGNYRLIVTVLDESMITPSFKGYIRFISLDHFETLETNSKWRIGDLKERLLNILSIEEPTDDDALEVWHFKPKDIQNVKDWVKENQENGVSREAQNAEFGSKFGECQIKGSYAD